MITIIGGGPAGLLVAREAASLGERVTVYEEHTEVGKPVQCTGLVSKSGLEALETNYEESVLNEVSRARFVSPSGKEFILEKHKGYALVINREVFDKTVAEEAQAEGARVILGRRGKPGKDITVGADGASSGIARKLGIKRKFLIGYQVENKMKIDTDTVELHFGLFAPGFFGWVVPISEGTARLGLAYDPEVAKRVHKSYDPRTGLRFLAKLRGFPWDPISHQGGLIPIYDGKPAVYGNIALVGDAAGQVKASTGGGIAIGGQCARILGQVLGTSKNLEEYESLWRTKFERELNLHLAIHRFQSRLSDSDLEEIFSLVDEEIISIVERYGEMEKVSTLALELAKYATRHPSKLLTIKRFMSYLDLNPFTFL